MRRTLTHRSSRRNHRALAPCAWVGLAFSVPSLLAAGCEGDYPLAPTFCDDWCRATLIASCDEDPEDCVEHCELTRPAAACLPLQEELLRCYERAPREAFSCAGVGFGAEVRVRPEVCAGERDALFECASPGIGQCLSSCRVAQQAQLAQVTLADRGLVDFSRLAEAGGPSCPALDRPCEELCWSVFGLESEGLASLGVMAGPIDLEATLECLEQTLLACFAQSGLDGIAALAGAAPGATGGPDAGAPGIGPGPAGETIAEAIARCGGAIALD